MVTQESLLSEKQLDLTILVFMSNHKSLLELYRNRSSQTT